MKKAVAIVDLQFGSTGKGLLAGTLAMKLRPDTVVHANYPNAGHTFQMEGRRWVFRMTANGFVAPSVKTMLIGPGAVIDIDCLRDELADSIDLLKYKQVIIHPAATILQPEHAEDEKQHVKIGSTMKGSAAAVRSKMMRDPAKSVTAGQLAMEDCFLPKFGDLAEKGLTIAVGREHYEEAVADSKLMLIEGAQGHSLSVHSRFYPYCTSRDVSVNQLLADCGLPRGDKFELIVGGTARTFPIRVANRFDDKGNQIGTSGGHYPDQKELDWKRDLGREPELTTVTKLPRRVFTFSDQQIREACRINRPDFIFLSFCDYLAKNPGISIIPLEVEEMRARIHQIAGVPVRMLSWGPGIEDVYAAADRQQHNVDEHVFRWTDW